MPFVLILIALLIPAVASADTLDIGDPMPILTFKDQYDASHTVDGTTRFVIFSAERDVSALVETALTDQSGDSLAAAGVQYISDISAMPGLITSVIALPKMRKRPYPMLLGFEAEETAVLPRQPGQVTLIRLEGGMIAAVQYIGDAATLRSALGMAP
jgi:hypothetical protein